MKKTLNYWFFSEKVARIAERNDGLKNIYHTPALSAIDLIYLECYASKFVTLQQSSGARFVKPLNFTEQFYAGVCI